MNKDDYAKMKVRHEIVMAFMNKKGETLDIDLIPALVDYAETGDRKMFDDYNNFRKMTDIEKRAKEMKERVEEARADLERCKDQLKKTEETSEENRSQINDAIEKYRQWVRELKDTITKENPQDEFPTMKTLRDFAQIKLPNVHLRTSQAYPDWGTDSCLPLVHGHRIPCRHG